MAFLVCSTQLCSVQYSNRNRHLLPPPSPPEKASLACPSHEGEPPTPVDFKFIRALIGKFSIKFFASFSRAQPGARGQDIAYTLNSGHR
jgi:hypothetical protein